MTYFKLAFFMLLAGVILSCQTNTKGFEFANDCFKISLDDKGYLQEISDNKTGANYLYSDSLSPLLSIRVDSTIHFPKDASFERNESRVVLHFENEYSATIAYELKESHINFELVALNGLPEVEMVIWGPYQTTINEVIGETVGVVQGVDFSLGLQALNPKLWKPLERSKSKNHYPILN